MRRMARLLAFMMMLVLLPVTAGAGHASESEFNKNIFRPSRMET